jgi:hypothetical protein
VYENLHKYGNTSSASIPIALCEAIQEGRVQDQDNLVFVGFGAGLTWGASVVRWGLPQPYQRRGVMYRTKRWAYYRWAEVNSHLRRLARTAETMLPRQTPLLDDSPEGAEPKPDKPTPPPPAQQISEPPPPASNPPENGHSPESVPEQEKERNLSSRLERLSQKLSQDLLPNKFSKNRSEKDLPKTNKTPSNPPALPAPDNSQAPKDNETPPT